MVVVDKAGSEMHFSWMMIVDTMNDDLDEDERVNDEHEDYQKEHDENGCYMMNDDSDQRVGTGI